MADPFEYSADDLKQINTKRLEMGLNPVDKFGAEVQKTKKQKAPKPRQTPRRVKGAPRTKELETHGKVLTQQELEAQQRMEEEFRNRVQEEAARLLADMPPEMKDVYAEDPEFGTEIANLALQNTLSDTEAMQHLVPGFKPKDWGDEPPTWESFGTDPLEAVFGLSQPALQPGRLIAQDEPAPPLELPPDPGTTWTEKLQMAAAPQTRLGEQRAERVKVLSAPKALKDPNEFAIDKGINTGGWTKWKQIDILTDTYEMDETGEDLQKLEAEGFKMTDEGLAYPDDWDDQEAKALDDREQYANYKGYYAAYHQYIKDNPGVDAQTALAEVSKSLQHMQKIVSGEGSEDDYITHDMGPKGPADPWYRAFSRSRVDGKVPNLDDTQKAFIEASTSQKRKFFLEEIPYMRAEQQVMGYGGDPDFEVQAFDYGEVGQEGFYDDQAYEKLKGAAPPTEEEAEALESEYGNWLSNRGLTDYWALDFMDDPEKYASGWAWNKSYPSGASVEGPVGWTFRSAMILPNIASHGIYEIGTGGFWEPDWVIESEERLDEIPENQLYKGHPYLRNIAHNRGLMNDAHDVFYYSEDYKDYAKWAGGAGLAVDILITPFDPGVSQAVKGTAAGLRGYKTIRALGGTKKTAAVVGTKDFASQALRGYADQSILGMVGKYRFMDPLDQASAHSYQWLRDEAAFKRAWDNWGDPNKYKGMSESERFTSALDEARDIAYDGVGTSRFFDDAAKKGVDRTFLDMNSQYRWSRLKGQTGELGPRYDQYLDDLDAFMKGKSTVLPKPQLTQNLLDGARKHSDELDNFARATGDDPETFFRALRNDETWKQDRFMHLLQKPLHARMGNRIAVDVVERGLLKGGFSGLNMVTPKLFLTADDMGKLSKAIGEDDISKALIQFAADGEKAVGFYPFFKTIGGQAGKRSFRPRKGSYVTIPLSDAKNVQRWAKELFDQGYLTKGEYDNVLAGLFPKQFAEKYAKGKSIQDVKEFYAKIPLGTAPKHYLSFDNLRMIMNGNMERLAYQKRLGISTEVLEEATTRTKVQIMNAYEARHMEGNWFRRTWKKIPWIGDKNARKWTNDDFGDMPMHAVIKVKELQGQLANIGTIIRKELNDILTNPAIARQYGLEGEVTRDDAIVAAMLGPIGRRTIGTMNSTIRNLVKVFVYNPKTTPLDVMDVFRSASVTEQRLFDNMSSEGREAFQRLLHGKAEDTLDTIRFKRENLDYNRAKTKFDEYQSLDPAARGEWLKTKPEPVQPVPPERMYGPEEFKDRGYIENFRDVRNAEDYYKTYERFYQDVEKIMTDPNMWKNSDAIPKMVGIDKMADITAGSYYIHKSLELADNTIDDIIRGWDGFDAMARSTEAMDRALKETNTQVQTWASTWKQKAYWQSVGDPVWATPAVYPAGHKLAGQPIAGTGATAEEFQRLGQVRIMDAVIERTKTLAGIRAHPPLVPVIGTPRVLGDWEVIVTDLFQVPPNVAQALAIDLANPALHQLDEMRKAIMLIKEGIDQKAFKIMKKNRLNSSDVEEGLQNLSTVLTDLEKYTTRWKGTGEPIPDEGLSRAEWRKQAGERAYGHQLDEELWELNDDIARLQDEVKDLMRERDAHMSGWSTHPWDDASRLEQKVRQLDSKELQLKRKSEHQVSWEMGLNNRMYAEFLDLLQTKLFGKTTKKKVMALRDQATTVNNVRKALRHLYDVQTTGGYNGVRFADNFLAWMTQMRYTLLLSSRVAFHSINVATAPTIIWGTLGGRGSLESFRNIKKAHQVWQVGSVRQNIAAKGAKKLLRAEEHAIALTDKMGRPYTYRDIWDLSIAKGGLRSQTAVIINAAQYQNVLEDTRFTKEYSDYVKEGMTRWLGPIPTQHTAEALGAGSMLWGVAKGGLKTTEGLGAAHLGGAMAGVTADLAGKYFPRFRGQNNWGKFLTDMTEFEDQYFRLTQVIDGLRRGEDPFVALQRGKHALYDYGSLNAAEKWASSRLFMFYAFFKLNMANTLKVMTGNPKRFANIFRSTQAPYLLLKDDEGPSPSELDFYKHHFLFSRPILKYVEGVDKTSHFIVMPPVPLLDGLQTAAEIIHAPNYMLASQPIRDLFNPEIKMLLGHTSRIEWKKKYVDPVDIYLVDESGLMEWFWDTWVGERPTAKLAVAGDVHYDGYTYHLSDEGMKKYLYFKNVVAPFMTAPNVMGSDTVPLTHWTAERLGMESTKLYGKAYGEEGEGEGWGVTGLVRRVGTIPIQSQRIAVINEVRKRLEEIEGGKGSGTPMKEKGATNEDIDALDYLSPTQRENIKRVREMQRQDELEREEKRR